MSAKKIYSLLLFFVYITHYTLFTHYTHQT